MMTFSRRALVNYAVEQLLGGKTPSAVSRQLAAALIVSKKPKEADLLLSDIAEILEDRGLLAQATVTSAGALPAKLLSDLSAGLKTAVKVKEVSLNQVINKDVIGGLRVETAQHTWDKTVARQLQQIRGGI